jgi:hypothetical protein
MLHLRMADEPLQPPADEHPDSTGERKTLSYRRACVHFQAQFCNERYIDFAP